jgi:hypothetical protein
MSSESDVQMGSVRSTLRGTDTRVTAKVGALEAVRDLVDARLGVLEASQDAAVLLEIRNLLVQIEINTRRPV